MAVQLMLAASPVARTIQLTCISEAGDEAAEFVPQQLHDGHAPTAGHTSASDSEILSILQDTFAEPMTNWRSHALVNSSRSAAYYNLGAFSQSVRRA